MMRFTSPADEWGLMNSRDAALARLLLVAADVADAKAVGCGGAILGKALLEGRMTLAEALACCAVG